MTVTEDRQADILSVSSHQTDLVYTEDMTTNEKNRDNLPTEKHKDYY